MLHADVHFSDFKKFVHDSKNYGILDDEYFCATDISKELRLLL